MHVDDEMNIEDAVFDQGGKVIVCVNVLPVFLTKNDGKWFAEFDDVSLFQAGPMYSRLRNIKGAQVVFVGVPATFVHSSEYEAVEEVLKHINCFPVFLRPSQGHRYFQGVCKGLLWPTFHSIIDLYSAKERVSLEDFSDGRSTDSSVSGGEDDDADERNWRPTKSWSPMEAEDCWSDYAVVNRHFANRVVEVFNEKDFVWVHDYQLLLLPSYLRRRLGAGASIGLYIHVPFPASEIFRILGSREEILRAMLSADHIGFNLFEYARHFLTCCSRMLGFKHGSMKGGALAVYMGARSVSITCAHIALDPILILDALKSERCEMAFKKQLDSRINDIQYIVGIDEVEGLRGLTLKLIAFERFLHTYPSMASSIRLKQYGINLDSRPKDYLQSKAEFLALQKRINREWDLPLVEYIELPSIDIHQRLAILRSANVFISTHVRSGVDVLPLEYLLARGSGEESAGVQIISEFSGCAKILNGPLRVNPWKTTEIAEMIQRALSMSGPEREARRARDLSYVEKSSLTSWGLQIISDIKSAHRAAQSSEAVLSYGLGFNVRAAGGAKDGRSLNIQEMCENLIRSNRRLFFFDYSGTLVETSSLDLNFKSGGSARIWHYLSSGPGRRPGGGLETREELSESIRNNLITLCQDPRNTVVVMTGDLRDELSHALEGIDNIGMIAENGFVYRVNPEADWVAVVNEKAISSENLLSEILDNSSWQQVASNIMNQYVFRTNLSFIWSAPSAVSFNWALADSELGSMQSQNLILELQQALDLTKVDIESGKGFVTVRLKGIHRGGAIRAFI